MKPLFTILALVSMAIAMSGQSPEKMSYQSVIRNAEGVLVQNSDVGIKISILQGSADGTSVYTETQTATSNANGLVTLEIGTGTTSDDFSAINWSTGPYFLKTETDPAGGTNYTVSGVSQLISVPYAFYAKTSSASVDAVKITGDQIIAGNKTFSGTTTVITPVNATDAANKEYVDKLIEQLYAQGSLRVRDIDGNYYNTVKIGNQIWMAENLKTTRYRNGDSIGTTTTPPTLPIDETKPDYQWAYDGVESNAAIYGRLYTWAAVTDSRNVCPVGFHLPSDAEWTILTDYLTANGYGYGGSGSQIGKSLAATSGWTAYETASTVGNDQASNNNSGFTALPGGNRNVEADFGYIGERSIWWSSTEFAVNLAYKWFLKNNSSYLLRESDYEANAFSVRCLRDL